MATDGSIVSSADNSRISISVDSAQVDGSVHARGANAVLAMRSAHQILLGQGSGGGNLSAADVGGVLSLQTGTGSLGIGFSMTQQSKLTAGALIEVLADGDNQLRGNVLSKDADSVITLRSRGQVWINGAVTAQDTLNIIGGSTAAKVGVLISTVEFAEDTTTPVGNKTGKYISGGQVDTAVGGRILISSTDSVLIEGTVGTGAGLKGSDLGRAKVGTFTVSSASGDITVLRNVTVRDHISMSAGNISVLSGAYVHTTGVDSDVFIEARDALLIYSKNGKTTETIFQALVVADKLIHLKGQRVEVNGNVIVGLHADASVDATTAAGPAAASAPLGLADGRVLVSAGTSLRIGGFISSDDRIDFNVGVNLALARTALESLLTLPAVSGGNIEVLGQGLLNALGKISMRAGGNVVIDADTEVSNGRNVEVVSYKLVNEDVQEVSGYHQNVRGGFISRSSS